jgi:DNA helicase-2/ATP-dependent DNA helicase PcrA
VSVNGFTPSPFQEDIFAAWTAIRPSHQHLSVNAVAGSGKSTTLEMALKKKPNEPALFCAFNRHIVDAAEPRFKGTRVKIATAHSIGMQTLGRSLPKRPRLDDNKYRKLVREYVREFQADYKEDHEATKRIGDLIKFARLTLTDYSNLGAMIQMVRRFNLDFDTKDKHAVESLLNHGQRLAETNGEIDFTDMIYLPVRLKMQPNQYPRVAVDECQDLSTAARRLLISCCAPGGRMLFVGDPRQAIMAFAGADANAYDEIHRELGTLPLPLSICYRCPGDVVKMAQEIVPQIEARPGAPAGTIDWRTEEDLHKQAQPGDLIMCRKNAPLLKHCLRLIRNGLHARVRGRDVGKEIANLIRSIGSTINSYDQFPDAVEFYYHQQKAVLVAKDASDAQLEMLDDKCTTVSECFAGLLDCRSVDELAARIETIFSDYGTAIWFSSIHRAKGLEANRTWILEFDRLGEPIGRNGSNEEATQELNLKYVALTRSLDTMFLMKREAK